tara:strand:+ start:251 stop:511 length:261 start_codon:yes stop_codon:yes gene_type:complete
MTDLPMSFKWQMPVWIETADVDIEVNYSSVEIEVTDFEADTSVTFNQALLEECLDMDDLYTLRRICVAVIEAREHRAREATNALET